MADEKLAQAMNFTGGAAPWMQQYGRQVPLSSVPALLQPFSQILEATWPPDYLRSPDWHLHGGRHPNVSNEALARLSDFRLESGLQPNVAGAPDRYQSVYGNEPESPAPVARTWEQYPQIPSIPPLTPEMIALLLQHNPNLMIQPWKAETPLPAVAQRPRKETAKK